MKKLLCILLFPFAVAAQDVTLEWEAPTTNVDETPLEDLASYLIEYGDSEFVLDRTMVVNDPAATSAIIAGLSNATWYFVIRAVDEGGLQSVRSNKVSIVVNENIAPSPPTNLIAR